MNAGKLDPEILKLISGGKAEDARPYYLELLEKYGLTEENSLELIYMITEEEYQKLWELCAL